MKDRGVDTQDQPLRKILEELVDHVKNVRFAYTLEDDVDEAIQAIEAYYGGKLEKVERELDLERKLNIKGIDDYRRFKGSDDEFERTAAWINQLSPHNLQRGAEHLKWRFTIKEQYKSQLGDKGNG